MAVESEVASQVVSMTLDGVKMSAEIAGKGLEKVGAVTLALISLIHKKQKEHKALSVGEKKLDLMRRSGNVLQDFVIPASSLDEFRNSANAFRLTYSLIKNNKTDEITIVGYQSEASRLSRIIEGLQLIDIKPEATQAQEPEIESSEINAPETVSPDEPYTDEQISELFEILNPTEPETSVEEERGADPFVTETDKSSPSEVFSKSLESEKNTTFDSSEKTTPIKTSDPNDRPSVRGRLKEIVEQQKEQVAKAKDTIKDTVSKAKDAVDALSK